MSDPIADIFGIPQDKAAALTSSTCRSTWNAATSVTATTVVIRNLTRRERLTAWLREVRYRVVRLWWRACDAVGSRVA